MMTGVLLSCSILPPKYDANEYMILAQLETHSRFMKTECSDPIKVRARLDDMMFNVELLSTYAFFLPRNSETFEISKILVEDIQEMSERYDDGDAPSTTYCKLKSRTFIEKARRVLTSIGKLSG